MGHGRGHSNATLLVVVLLLFLVAVGGFLAIGVGFFYFRTVSAENMRRAELAQANAELTMRNYAAAAAAASESSAEISVPVTVDAMGQAFLTGEPIDVDQLLEHLQQVSEATEASPVVTLRVDPECRYVDLQAVEAPLIESGVIVVIEMVESADN